MCCQFHKKPQRSGTLMPKSLEDQTTPTFFAEMPSDFSLYKSVLPPLSPSSFFLPPLSLISHTQLFITSSHSQSSPKLSMFSYLISKIFGTSFRRAEATATSCLTPTSCLSPPTPTPPTPTPPPSLPTPLYPPLPQLSTDSTEYSESEDLKFSSRTTEYSDLMKNIPRLIPTKVENANYADKFDSRIITTVSAVSSKKGCLVEKGKARKRKNVVFDLSANTLHKYNWSTLGHDDFPERLTEEEKYLCMVQYRPAILYRYPNSHPRCWRGYLGRVEYSYLSYEENANEDKRRRIEARARKLMWSFLAILVSFPALVVICLLNS